MYVYRGWIETAPPGSTEWQRYEGVEEDIDDDAPPGVFLAEESMFDDLEELARWLLKYRLDQVVRHYADQPDLQIRACAQTCEQSEAGPTVIREPSPQALAIARHAVRQGALTEHLRSAWQDVYDARRSLEAAIVHTHKAGLSRPTINRAVSPFADAEEVAHIIDQPVLFQEVRRLVRTRSDLGWRTAVRRGPMPDVTVELRWSNEEYDAEQLRERAWNETIEEYDPELAATLLGDARRAAGELLALLSTQFEVTPTTPDAVAPQILSYNPIRVRRLASERSDGDHLAPA